ncbi:MAG: tol-pal system protein YbgF [Litoreibacter sp.]|nr:tol-pal system protein YbgF [Litoreibacter sp.]
MRFFVICLACLSLGSPSWSQDREATLADIRQELSVLSFELQTLKRQLSTTGGPALNIGGQSGIDRLNSIEAAVASLTSKTEELENRINRIVRDGTNQVGDLQFRLCELTTECDIATLPDPLTLGGETAVPSLGDLSGDGGDGVELAVAEVADFERAELALADGEYEAAANQFAQFIAAYPGGPLSTEAHFLRGEALARLGDWNSAARAYLDSFSGAPNDGRAPEALYKLGLSLNELGQTSRACLMLAEVEKRFPASDQVGFARDSQLTLGCS